MSRPRILTDEERIEHRTESIKKYEKKRPKRTQNAAFVLYPEYIKDRKFILLLAVLANENGYDLYISPLHIDGYYDEGKKPHYHFGLHRRGGYKLTEDDFKEFLELCRQKIDCNAFGNKVFLYESLTAMLQYFLHWDIDSRLNNKLPYDANTLQFFGTDNNFKVLRTLKIKDSMINSVIDDIKDYIAVHQITNSSRAKKQLCPNMGKDSFALSENDYKNSLVEFVFLVRGVEIEAYIANTKGETVESCKPADEIGVQYFPFDSDVLTVSAEEQQAVLVDYLSSFRDENAAEITVENTETATVYSYQSGDVVKSVSLHHNGAISLLTSNGINKPIDIDNLEVVDNKEVFEKIVDFMRTFGESNLDEVDEIEDFEEEIAEFNNLTALEQEQCVCSTVENIKIKQCNNGNVMIKDTNTNHCLFFNHNSIVYCNDCDYVNIIGDADVLEVTEPNLKQVLLKHSFVDLEQDLQAA